jgi:uncharacterized protein (DUF2249 family)
VHIAAEVGNSGDGAPAVGAPRQVLDVRPLLARGEEPFDAILRAVDGLDDDQVLLLRSPFDPQPLHVLLGRRGFARQTLRLAPDDYETAYRLPGAVEANPRPRHPDAAPAESVPRAAHVLDVRGLLPPEPLERTFAALETLPADDALLQVNERVPAFLIPELDDRGYSYRIEHDERGTLVTIWRATEQ